VALYACLLKAAQADALKLVRKRCRCTANTVSCRPSAARIPSPSKYYGPLGGGWQAFRETSKTEVIIA
jgi:hypothetical protein